MKKMGGLSGLMDKLPSQLTGQAAQLGQADMDRAERDVRRMEGIICSMTPLERRKPELLKATRKRRIAAGAGVQVQDVNRLLNQFEQMQRHDEEDEGRRPDEDDEAHGRRMKAPRRPVRRRALSAALPPAGDARGRRRHCAGARRQTGRARDGFDRDLIARAAGGCGCWPGWMLRAALARRPRATTPVDRLDTARRWPPKATRVLTTQERLAYSTLLRALPGYMVLAQVPLARFLRCRRGYSYSEWLRRLGNQCADLVVCDMASQ